MITVKCSARGADRILLRLSNGWTASIAPHDSGRAFVAAWASHEDRPRAGGLNVIGGEPLDADGIVGFLSTICTAERVPA